MKDVIRAAFKEGVGVGGPSGIIIRESVDGGPAVSCMDVGQARMSALQKPPV